MPKGFKKGYIPWNKGKKCPNLGFKKGNIPWTTGKIRPESVLVKLRKPRPCMQGKNNPSYKQVKLICHTCKKEFYKSPSQIKAGYCSHACSLINNPNLKGCPGAKNYHWKGGISKDKEHLRKMRNRQYYLYPTKKRLNQKRISILRGVGELTVQIIQKIYEDNIKKYGTLTCYLCMKPIEFKQDSLEHKIPLIRGGNNSIENLDIAHRICNSKKNRKTEEEYRKEVCHQP